MNDISRLTERLSEAFDQLPAEPRAAHVPSVQPGSIPMDEEMEKALSQLKAAFEKKPETAEPVQSRLHWYVGGVMLFFALDFSTGSPTAMVYGLYALAIAFAAYLALRSFGQLRELSSRRAEIKAAEEKKVDREWVAVENLSLMGSLHDQLGDIALLRDEKGGIRAVNAVFTRLTGQPHASGMQLSDAGLTLGTPGPDGHYTAELKTPKGLRHFICADTTIRDPKTGELMLQIVGRDVTEARKSEEAAAAAIARAEAASEAKSRLLATVAHEVRTPLTGLLGMADLLEKSRLMQDQRNYVAGLCQSGQVLSYLVEDLLDFATLEAGRFELRPVAESPRRLIEGVVEMLAPRAHFKGLEIASFVAPDVPEYLEFDPARLRQVLFNVVGNAVKFTRQGGVSVSASIEGKHFVIRVADTGPGMTPEEKARIFDEFVQVGNSVSRSGGKGLGLAISARLVDAFGGHLNVDSRKGEGSLFTISLPLPHSMRGNFSSARLGLMGHSSVMLIAPEGPAASAIQRTIRALGGRCERVGSEDAALKLLGEGEIDGRALTDIVVDHRLERIYITHIAMQAGQQKLRRIFLVNPEDRQARISGPYDAWLIRPLREQSLIDVMGGKLRGLEKRGATNDNLPANQPQAGPQPSGGLNILLGEDDPVNALLVKKTLESAGHLVSIAGDFDDLLGELFDPAAAKPDLLITDLNMPGAEGLDVLARIRNTERLGIARPVPILVLSGDTTEETREQALQNGANRVLAKPASPSDLIAAVQAICPTFRLIQQG